MDRFVVQPHQLLGFQCHDGVGPPVVVAKFDFVHTGSPGFDYCTDLAAHKTVLGQVFQQCHNRMHLNRSHSQPLPL